MSKKNQIFRESPPPTLSRVLTIAQHQNELIDEHWKHLITCLEIQEQDKRKHCYLIYKSKCFVAFVNFEEGCLLYQRKFKIPYSQVFEITCLTLRTLTIKSEQTQKREVILAVGFFDGSFEIYHLIVTDKSVMLRKITSFGPIRVKEPVTNILFHRKNIYVARLHSVTLYKQALDAVFHIIVQNEYEKTGKEIDPDKMTCVIKTISAPEMAQGNKLGIFSGLSRLYLFNETEGAKSFTHASLEQNGSIIDAITFLRETTGEVMVIGDTGDKLKIIYSSRGLVDRFSGFKSYCSAMENIVFQAHQQLWVADYHGCITYFTRVISNQTPTAEQPKSIKLIDSEVKHSTRVIENGIKEMKVCGKLLFIFDTESNIHIYDVIRQGSLRDERPLQIEDIENDSNE